MASGLNAGIAGTESECCKDILPTPNGEVPKEELKTVSFDVRVLH